MMHDRLDVHALGSAEAQKDQNLKDFIPGQVRLLELHRPRGSRRQQAFTREATARLVCASHSEVASCRIHV